MAGEKLRNSFPFTITHDKGEIRQPSEHMGDAFQVADIPPLAKGSTVDLPFPRPFRTVNYFRSVTAINTHYATSFQQIKPVWKKTQFRSRMNAGGC